MVSAIFEADTIIWKARYTSVVEKKEKRHCSNFTFIPFLTTFSKGIILALMLILFIVINQHFVKLQDRNII